MERLRREQRGETREPCERVWWKGDWFLDAEAV